MQIVALVDKICNPSLEYILQLYVYVEAKRRYFRAGVLFDDFSAISSIELAKYVAS